MMRYIGTEWHHKGLLTLALKTFRFIDKVIQLFFFSADIVSRLFKLVQHKRYTSHGR
jgi:hypothetical protein